MKYIVAILYFILLWLPEFVAQAFFIGRRRVYEGRVLGAKPQAFGEFVRALTDKDRAYDALKMRKLNRDAAGVLDGKGPPLPLIEDCTILLQGREVPVRLFDTEKTDAPRPTLIYFHGGGYVIGGLDSHHGTCARLARFSGLRMLSVDYAMAPEHRWPDAQDEALALHHWLAEQGTSIGVDADRLAYGGDSAGGNLTAILMQDLVAAKALVPRAQLLIYPSVDCTLQNPVYEKLKDAYVLDQQILHWFIDSYIPDKDQCTSPRASPLYSKHLTGQPPAYLLTCGHDPLRPDTEIYRDKLMAAGVDVTYRELRHQIHGFINIARVDPDTELELAKAARWLKQTV